MVLSDDLHLEILALYGAGWEASEIAEMLRLPAFVVRDTLTADAVEFPDDPLRVLH